MPRLPTNPLDGLIVTKLDGSGKGGIAVTIHEPLGIPPRFLGTGEEPEAFAIFEKTAFLQEILYRGADCFPPPFPRLLRFTSNVISPEFYLDMKTILAIATLPFLFISCAQQSLTGDTYSQSEVGHAQTVKKGRISSIRYVKIEGGTAAGTVIGGVAGGILGNQIGGGKGRTLATLGGVGVGAVAGSQTQKAIETRQGIEIQVHLDSGKTMAVTQEVNPHEPFAVGDRVRVLYNGGRARISH